MPRTASLFGLLGLTTVMALVNSAANLTVSLSMRSHCVVIHRLVKQKELE